MKIKSKKEKLLSYPKVLKSFSLIDLVIPHTCWGSGCT